MSSPIDPAALTYSQKLDRLLTMVAEMNIQLTTLNRRLDAHEARIMTLELDRAAVVASSTDAAITRPLHVASLPFIYPPLVLPFVEALSALSLVWGASLVISELCSHLLAALPTCSCMAHIIKTQRRCSAHATHYGKPGARIRTPRRTRPSLRSEPQTPP